MKRGSSETAAQPSGAAGVSNLLADRERFENWLRTLESKKASTPAHVYARVRDDYEKRLSQVIDQLGAHREELDRSMESLTARVHQLETDEQAKRDERAEAEVRAAVGEYSDKQWNQISRESDDAIAAIVRERESVTEELGRLREVLGRIASPTPPSMPRLTGSVDAMIAEVERASREVPAQPDEPVPVSSAAPGDAMLDIPEAEVASSLAVEPVSDVSEQPAPIASSAEHRAPSAPESAPPPPRSSRELAADRRPSGAVRPDHLPEPSEFDELAFLKSVVGARMSGAQTPVTPMASSAVSSAPPAPARPAEPPPQEPAPESAVSASASSAPASPPPLVHPPDHPRRPEPASAERPSANRPSVETSVSMVTPADSEMPTANRRLSKPDVSPPAATPLSNSAISGRSTPEIAPRPTAGSGNYSALRGVQSEQTKSLRCGECGTMNYPTEWYCERCGAELAAM